MINQLLSAPIGTVLWASVSFLIVMFLLKKFAWKPILEGLKAREHSIADSLTQAEKAKEEMANLQSENENLLKEARAERDLMLKEARETKEKLISDAKAQAKEEGEKMIASAKEAINTEKNAAMAELKSQVGSMSIDIAEKLVKGHLADKENQKTLVDSILNEIKLN